eukprot:12422074-Heterocapsa_arctica.AAC.1
MDLPLLWSDRKLTGQGTLLMTANDLDFDEKRDSEKDPNDLAKDKKTKGGDTYYCEQEKIEQNIETQRVTKERSIF